MLIDKLFNLEWCPLGGRRDAKFYSGWQKRAGVMRKDMLSHAHVFDITNVAEYLYREVGEDGWDYSKDFPRPMPPFQMLWAEWSFPVNSRRKRGGEIGEFWIRKWMAERAGCLMVTEANDGRYSESAAPGSMDHVAWTIRFFPFLVPLTAKMVGICPEIIIGLASDYSITDLGSKNCLINYPVTEESERSEWDFMTNPGESGGFVDEIIEMMNVPLLAMSLINCRNVSTRDVPTPPKLIKANNRRGKHTTAMHRIIEIQPMVNRIHSATGSHGYSRAACPIVRGHFKDYTERGLFGKLKGTFWWDQRVNAPLPKEYRLKKSIGDLDRAWNMPIERTR